MYSYYNKKTLVRQQTNYQQQLYPAQHQYIPMAIFRSEYMASPDAKARNSYCRNSAS